MRDNGYSVRGVTASGGNIGKAGSPESPESHRAPLRTGDPYRKCKTPLSDRKSVSGFGHSEYNLAPMAALAEYLRKPGFREGICLPDGSYRTHEIHKSVPRPDGSYWLIWRACTGRASQPLWVTSTSHAPAIPYDRWQDRQDHIESLL